MIKLMIFDLDGTLIDSIHDLAAATNWVLKRHGYPTHPTDAYHYFVGDGVLMLIARALPEEARTPEIIAQLKTEQVAYYHEHMQDNTKPFHGISEVLLELQNRGYSLAVVTNKPNEQAQQLVKDFFPKINFIQVFGNRDGIPHKPDPTCVNMVIEQSGFTKDETLYIGDSDVDMLVANNAKVKGIGVLWGYRTKEELQKAGAYAIVDKVEDLLRIAQNNH
ncbi:phosphoglycolate phosphatase [Hydrogenoanaerobacterium saccharovorans]|uniref:Phosphoglycolate phosphatase n=1 Tax=Hydrogenoanaerobacterium saccharovorans TaxID=474960 RepID=A0A1H7ZR27_9FIRM|nr:HAD family hydrolase [Hydrogenoanaerobacterium saccharovorans]RPF48472.1 phosphoglycolate phosphatase [Hydrogenoanaerobacterium saccharovorans]SEM60274.1 phosphoglycolate phosphatase [Hydrogenoanaerobacterium saccharovorans]